jgi:hypothetical protein
MKYDNHASSPAIPTNPCQRPGHRASGVNLVKRAAIHAVESANNGSDQIASDLQTLSNYARDAGFRVVTMSIGTTSDGSLTLDHLIERLQTGEFEVIIASAPNGRITLVSECGATNPRPSKRVDR